MLRSISLALLATFLAPTVGAPKAYLAQSPEINDLPTTPPQTRPASEGDAVVIQQAHDGLFYVDAKVNGAPVRFVVDSGASVVILNAADAARAGVAPRDGVSVDTAGGAATMHRARLQRLALAGQDLSNVDAVIVQRDLEVSLLGQSALTQMRPITFRGSRMELH